MAEVRETLTKVAAAAAVTLISISDLQLDSNQIIHLISSHLINFRFAVTNYLIVARLIL
jgi:hypothetical protein